MNFLRGIINGLQEVWGHKVRSFLTMIGIVLGVAALVGWQAAGGDHVIRDGSATDQVFLNNAFENIRPTRSVPGTFGIHDRDRAIDANLQAVGLGSIDST